MIQIKEELAPPHSFSVLRFDPVAQKWKYATDFFDPIAKLSFELIS